MFLLYKRREKIQVYQGVENVEIHYPLHLLTRAGISKQKLMPDDIVVFWGFLFSAYALNYQEGKVQC